MIEADRGRVSVLGTAAQLVRETGSPEVTDEQILEYLELNRARPLPWSNPRAVISSILARSGQWEKVEPGKYRRKDATELITD